MPSGHLIDSVRYSDCPLLEIPLYMVTKHIIANFFPHWNIVLFQEEASDQDKLLPYKSDLDYLDDHFQVRY